MINFSSLISRADSDVLANLLGRQTVSLLVALEEGVANTSQLRELLVAMKSPHELLEDPATKAELVDLLSEAEARELCETISLGPTTDPWADLRARSITKSKRNLWHGFFGLPALRDATPPYIPERSKAESSYGLFRHQRTALRELAPLLGGPQRRAMLHMPTGSGKTRTAMNLVAEHLRHHEPTVVFWLANSEELCAQAADEFEKAWRALGNREVETYRLWGGRRVGPDELHDGLVVASLATVYSRQVSEGTWTAFAGDRTSLVIMDEAHQAIAQTYRFVLDALVARNRKTALLGLSATPGRTWNDPVKDAELADFFARQKVTLKVKGYPNPVAYLVDEGYLARANYRSVEHNSEQLTDGEIESLSEALDVPETILRRLADDEVRSIKIVRHAEDLARRHKRILIFATTKDHAERLALVLSARGLAARSITSSTPTQTRENSISWYKSDTEDVRILTNYGVLTTGFDAPLTSAALIARPTTSLVLFSQMIGRATRGVRAGGNATAEILTVVDTSLPGFGSMSEAFNNWEDVW